MPRAPRPIDRGAAGQNEPLGARLAYGTARIIGERRHVHRVEPQARESIGQHLEVLRWHVLKCVLYVIVGLGMATFGFYRGGAIRRLLIHGTVARGRLISTERTNTVINNQPVMRN